MGINKFEESTGLSADQQALADDLIQAGNNNIHVTENTRVVSDEHRITVGDLKYAINQLEDDLPIMVVLGVPGTVVIGYLDIVAVSEAVNRDTGKRSLGISVLPEGLL